MSLRFDVAFRYVMDIVLWEFYRPWHHSPHKIWILQALSNQIGGFHKDFMTLEIGSQISRSDNDNQR